MHADRGSLAAVDPADFSAPSSKQAAEALASFTPFGSTGGNGRALVVLVDGEENAVLSFRNIEGVHVLRAGDVGVADVIGAARLIASPAALESLAKVAAAPVKTDASRSPEAAQ